MDVTVRGRVQGVSFRMHAAEEARRQGVSGWVRNEPDGSVRAHLEGPGAAVEAMLAWCHEGSPYAAVESVEVAQAAASGATGFRIA